MELAKLEMKRKGDEKASRRPAWRPLCARKPLLRATSVLRTPAQICAFWVGALVSCGLWSGCVPSTRGEGAEPSLAASPAPTWTPRRKVMQATEPVVSVEELLAASGAAASGAAASGAGEGGGTGGKGATAEGGNSGKPSGGETAPPAAVVPQTKVFSLQEFKLPLTIEAPVDTKVTASASKDKLGGALLSSYDNNVSLRVMKADARIATPASAKVTLGKLAYLPAKTFLKEKVDLLVYERSDEEVYFLNWVKVAGVTYTCQSMGGAESEAELENALHVCKTIKKAP